jgi:hypothetical protein
VYDHLVHAAEGGVLVRHDTDPPARGVGSAAVGPHGVDLRRGE